MAGLISQGRNEGKKYLLAKVGRQVSQKVGITAQLASAFLQRKHTFSIYNGKLIDSNIYDYLSAIHGPRGN